MKRSKLDPEVRDTAPTDDAITDYDRDHLVTYVRLLDAEKDEADWREVAMLVLHLDPAQDSERAKRVYNSHLARAQWMTTHGYRHLLSDQQPER